MSVECFIVNTSIFQMNISRLSKSSLGRRQAQKRNAAETAAKKSKGRTLATAKKPAKQSNVSRPVAYYSVTTLSFKKKSMIICANQ